MKVRVMSNALAEGVKCVLPASNAKSTVDVYANVKIETGDRVLCLTATNGTLTIYSEVECEVEEPGATTMPMQLLNRIVATLPVGEVCLTESDDRMKIKAGASKFNLTGIPADQFPKLSADAMATRITIPASEIRKLVRRTSYAQSVDDTRRTLQGVLVEIGGSRIRMVATDGRRLAVAEKTDVAGAEGDVCRYIIPSSSVVAVQNFMQGDGEAIVEGSGSMICLSLNGGKQKLYTRLVDGSYPDYTQVIPKSHAVDVELDRDVLVSSLQRVSVMASDSLPTTKFTFSENMMVLNVNGTDGCNARDEIPVKYDGSQIDSFFCPKYIIDPLKTIDADSVVMELTDGHSPAKFVSKDDRFMYVLMPLRVNDGV